MRRQPGAHARPRKPLVPPRARKAAGVVGIGGLATALLSTTPLLPAEAVAGRTAPPASANLVVSAATAPVTIAQARVSAAALDAAVAQRSAERATQAEIDRVAAEAARVAAEQTARIDAARAALGPCVAAEVTAGYSNGRVPDSALCDLPGTGHQLRSDAALAYVLLNDAYRVEFGTDIPIIDSYRSYSAQVSLKRQKGRMAATPGNSNHGEGVALDLGGGISGFNHPEHDWMRANAPAYGWDLPTWARKGGSKPEPWHWEYVG